MNPEIVIPAIFGAFLTSLAIRYFATRPPRQADPELHAPEQGGDQ